MGSGLRERRCRQRVEVLLAPQALTVRLRLQAFQGFQILTPITLYIQTRGTILSEHLSKGSTPPCLRRSRLSVAQSLQTMLRQRPALIKDPMLRLGISSRQSTRVYHLDQLGCSFDRVFGPPSRVTREGRAATWSSVVRGLRRWSK